MPRTWCRRSARGGANCGIQDADNLAWKLDLVLAGQAPERLLDSYDAERAYAADENIRHSTRSHRFHHAEKRRQPHVSRRRAVRSPKRTHSRERWSTAAGCRCRQRLSGSSLNTPDSAGAFGGGPVPGAVAIDAPVAGPRGGWLLGYLDAGFALLCFGSAVPADAVRSLAQDGIACAVVQVGGAPSSGACLIEDSRRPRGQTL